MIISNWKRKLLITLTSGLLPLSFFTLKNIQHPTLNIHASSVINQADPHWKSTYVTPSKKVTPEKHGRIQYTYLNIDQTRMLTAVKGAHIYKHPYQKHMHPSKLHHRLEVQPITQAVSSGHTTYDKVNYRGHKLGWIRLRYLKKSKSYQLPFTYTSQFWPSRASDACEAAALKMTLSTQGVDTKTSLATMVHHIPKSKNPRYGYTHNPFKYGSKASIYPHALAEVASQHHVRAEDITGAKKGQLINYIEHGDAIVFEGEYRMNDSKSDHALALLGYRYGKFFFADPLSRKNGYKITGWVSTNKFMKIFDSKVHGKRAIAILHRD